IPKGSFKNLRELGIKALLELIAAYVDSEVAETLSNVNFKDARPFLLSTVSDRADEWSRPGILLLGDAAHTMSPVGGQGLNIAIRDAIVAANHLIPAFEKPLNTHALLAVCQCVERERMNEVVPIQNLQGRGPKIMLNESIWMRAAFSVAQKIGSGREIDASLDPSFQQMLMGVTSVRWLTES
ncbi:FAD-dependent monooxygenase, partial [Gammaproteobacteria bacterium]|nr:FAD-dependent monooxygenase [Gammaproteobacteria bacterium]